MVKLIVGLAGSGKTKTMIDMVNAAAKEEHGNVVCIERGDKLRFDICNEARLIDSTAYDLSGYKVMRGFITGLYAGNFDTTHIFIDSLHKVADSKDIAELEKFTEWLERFSNQEGVDFTVSVGIEKETLSPYLATLAD